MEGGREGGRSERKERKGDEEEHGIHFRLPMHSTLCMYNIFPVHAQHTSLSQRSLTFGFSMYLVTALA